MMAISLRDARATVQFIESSGIGARSGQET
jgi:hypothetical protein